MPSNEPDRPLSRHTQERIVAICDRQHGMIEAVQLHVAGLGQSGVRARVEAQTLFVQLPLVYSLSRQVTEDGRRAAALLYATKWRALGAWSAAELYRFGRRPDGAHHVITTGRAGTLPGRVVVERTRAVIPVRQIRGMPVVEPGRALLDIARTTKGRPLERLVGEALFRRVISEAGVRAVPQRYPGHTGCAHLRAIDPHRARLRRTETELEERVLEILDGLAIPPFVCQYPIRGLSGKVHRVDFAWERERVVLEADGRQAHERRATMERDNARNADLSAVGWLPIRVTWHQLDHDRAAFVSSLVATLQTRV